MARLRVHNLAMSLDGYAAGAEQSVDNPLGIGGEGLHTWVFETRTGRAMMGQDGGSTDVDDNYLVAGTTGIGATIMGRNMFGPIRGPWPDDEWRGWWGDDPPYHHPVFVLTHYPREPLEMAGGTTFHFVTDGAEVALERAYAAADGLDVRLGGGAATVQEYLRAGLVDELHVPVVPIVLGAGERLFGDLDVAALGYTVTEHVASPRVAHMTLVRAH